MIDPTEISTRLEKFMFNTYTRSNICYIQTMWRSRLGDVERFLLDIHGCIRNELNGNKDDKKLIGDTYDG